MDNNMQPKKPEEVLHGGQMSIVIGFIATFLLGVVFVFVMGNLLGQISDGVQSVNLELSGNRAAIISTTQTACLNGLVRGENNDILLAADKTNDAKTEEILNRYNAESLTKLSTLVENCAKSTVPSMLMAKVKSTSVAKSGAGLSIETALQRILK
jgi:hypothetical protein